MKTKAQLVNDCFNELRISGITSQATPEDIALALGRLENLVAELPFDVGFRFESTPSPNTPAGLAPFAEYPIAMTLAARMAPIYGKEPGAIAMRASAAMSQLQNRLAMPRRVSYPGRMPMGMGNRRVYVGNANYPFMPEIPVTPSGVDTETIVSGDLRSFGLDFVTALANGETIASYEFVADSGLLITADSSSGSIVSFKAQADEVGYFVATFTATGSAGTVASLAFSANVVAQQIQRAT